MEMSDFKYVPWLLAGIFIGLAIALIAYGRFA
jgi:hypothetical protein